MLLELNCIRNPSDVTVVETEGVAAPNRILIAEDDTVADAEGVASPSLIANVVQKEASSNS